MVAEPMFERKVAGVTLRAIGGLAEITWPSGRVQLMNPAELQELSRQLEVSALNAMFKDSASDS